MSRMREITDYLLENDYTFIFNNYLFQSIKEYKYYMKKTISRKWENNIMTALAAYESKRS